MEEVRLFLVVLILGGTGPGRCSVRGWGAPPARPALIWWVKTQMDETYAENERIAVAAESKAAAAAEAAAAADAAAAAAETVARGLR